jgi:DNA gyrase inhibitor GyrI
MAVQAALREMEGRIERLQSTRAAYVHSYGINSSEDAAKRIMEWASMNGLFGKNGVRLFGRYTYPVDKAHPHGYECFLTVGNHKEQCLGAETRELPAGLYAVLRFRDPRNIDFAWKKLWNWIEENGYENVGWKKGEHGWVNGFEEHVNWQDQKPPTEWLFDLWVAIKE